jgi:glycine oxidase
MADVLVVGGGVIGCAIAYYLAKASVAVDVLERREIGGEASGAAAGMLIHLDDALPSDSFRDLCRASVEMFPALVGDLQEETGIDVEYLTTGMLVVADTEERARGLRELVRLSRAFSPTLEWVEGEVLRRLEPALSPGLAGAVYSADEHHVNPGRLTQALARAAAAQGATLHLGECVTGLLTRGDRVVGVRAASRIAADHVVLAAGPWTRMLGEKLGVDAPTRPMRGQMLAYRSSLVRNMVWGVDGYLVPKAGGFLFAGATIEDVGFRPRTTERGLASMRRMACSLVPALRYAEVSSAWAALRPGSPDGLPILGPVPGWQGLTVASGHFRNGILLAPVTGQLIARSILDGRPSDALAPFSPARFLDRG